MLALPRQLLSCQSPHGKRALKAEDVGSAAQGLVEFIVAQHLGQSNISCECCAELKVKIQAKPLILGLFFKSDATFHV
jgi:hypothetical protein